MRWPRSVLAGFVLSVAVTAMATIGSAEAATPTVYFYLPWEPNQSATVSQGQSDTPTHSGNLKYAYDFVLSSTNKEVLASAPGTIYRKDTTVTGQTGPGSWGNYVVLKHPDGTCTRYAHMKYGSVTSLSTGSWVYQGQKLGVQGNTGYTLPPGGGFHLHMQRENCTTGTAVSMDIDFVEIANPLRDKTYTATNPIGLKCGNAYATQVGTSSGQTIYGTEGADVVVALGGNDHVFGYGGDDVICVGSGNDRISGEAGNDRLWGESGNDVLSGGSGVDRMLGGSGDDIMDGGSDNDGLWGEAGRDTLYGGLGTADLCDGGPDTDTWSGCETLVSLP